MVFESDIVNAKPTEPMTADDILQLIGKPSRAFFVLGIEGAGTNMLLEALVEAGCGWSEEKQGKHFNFKFKDELSPFAFRRSIPHGGEHRDIWKIADELDESFDELHTQ